MEAAAATVVIALSIDLYKHSACHKHPHSLTQSTSTGALQHSIRSSYRFITTLYRLHFRTHDREVDGHSQRSLT